MSKKLFRAISDPDRIRWEIGKRRRATYTALRSLPFKTGLTTLWPGTYMAYLPDRYSTNREEYLRRGGAADPRDISGFIHHNKENNCGDLVRFYFLRLVIDQILKDGLKGDVAELGVFRGNSAYMLADLARGIGSTAYLLDTFSGFSTDDLHGIDEKVKMSFQDTSVQAVQLLTGEENVRFIQGHFPQSASQMPDNLSFCLVHIDCDLYDPFNAALQYFYPRLMPGGFMVMHDYSGLSWGGVERAIDDFLRDKPEKVVPIPDKSGTAVIRKSMEYGITKVPGDPAA